MFFATRPPHKNEQSPEGGETRQGHSRPFFCGSRALSVSYRLVRFYIFLKMLDEVKDVLT